MRYRPSSFQRVLAAEVVSNFGSLMSRLAIPWLAVLVLQASPTAMAWIAMSHVAAGALAALLLGALVDAWPKRRTMIAADLIRAASLLSLPLLAALGGLTLPWLVAVVAINGVMTVAFELAQSVWIARSTVHEELTQRNAALAAGGAATEAVSFGVTGWLFQWLGAIAVMLTNVVTYLLSAALLLRISEPTPAVAHRPAASTLFGRARALGVEIQAGLRATAAEPVLRTLAVVATLVEFAMSFAATTYMIYVSRDLALPTGILGLLFALGGVGSLFATWATARSAHRIPARTWLIGSLLLWAVGSAAAPAATTAGLIGVVLIATQQIAAVRLVRADRRRSAGGAAAASELGHPHRHFRRILSRNGSAGAVAAPRRPAPGQRKSMTASLQSAATLPSAVLRHGHQGRRRRRRRQGQARQAGARSPHELHPQHHRGRPRAGHL